MRDLVHDLFVKSPLLVGPIIALTIFLVIFAAVAARVWRRGRGAYQAAANLPLEDGHE